MQVNFVSKKNPCQATRRRCHELPPATSINSLLPLAHLYTQHFFESASPPTTATDHERSPPICI